MERRSFNSPTANPFGGRTCVSRKLPIISETHKTFGFLGVRTAELLVQLFELALVEAGGLQILIQKLSAGGRNFPKHYITGGKRWKQWRSPDRNI